MLARAVFALLWGRSSRAIVAGLVLLLFVLLGGGLVARLLREL
ncbi:MAG: hypothetical protein ACOC83_06545 [Gemmatimonadota bacterium]